MGRCDLYRRIFARYERALPTAAYFAMNGFRVMSCPWRKTGVALEQYGMMRQARAHATVEAVARIFVQVRPVDEHRQDRAACESRRSCVQCDRSWRANSG